MNSAKSKRKSPAPSRDEYKLLFATHPQPMYIFDEETLQFLAVNAAAEKFYGWTRTEFLEMSVLDVRPEGERERVRQIIGSQRGAREANLGVFQHRNRQGQPLVVEVAASSVTFRGRPARLCLLKDVTAEQKLRGDLDLLVHKYSELFKNTSDGFCIHDLSGMILEVNDSYCRMSGYAREELLWQPVTKVEAGFDQTQIVEHIRAVLATGEMLFESQHRRKDGTLLEVEVKVVFLGVEGGRLAAFVRDISERKTAEEARHASEERLQFVLDSCRIGAWEMDVETQQTIRSPKHDQVYGYATLLPEWTYEMFLQHVVPEDRARVDATYRNAVQQRCAWNFEFRIRRPDGQVRWIWATGDHQPDAHGKPRRVAGVVLDITARKQAEEARRYHAELLDKVSDAIISTDASAHIVSWNKGAERLYGWTAEEAIGKHPHELLREEFPGRSQAEMVAALQAQGQIESEVIHHDRQGRRLWVQVNVSLLKDEGAGTVTGIIGVMRDITARKTAEAALRASEEEYRTLADNATDMIILREFDGPIVYRSPSCSRVLGWTDEETARQRFPDHVHPDDVPLVAKVREAGMRGEPTLVAFRHLKKDGNYLWIESLAHDVHTPDGRTLRLIVARDISERKKAEAKLREGEERFRLAAAATHAMVYDLNVTSHVVNSMNGLRELLGYEATEAHLTLDWWDRQIHPDDLAKCHAAFSRMHDSGGGHTLNYRLRHKDGRTIEVEDNAITIRDVAGKLVRIVGTVVDITARKQSEDQLRESEQRLRALYASMSEGLALHELVYADGKAVDYVITDVNPAYERNTGLKRSDAIGRRATQVYGTPEAPYLDMFARVAEGGAPEQFETFFAPMNKHFAISVFSPGKGLFATVFTDITERKAAEDKLRASEERFRLLHENMRDAFVQVNMDGQIIDFNDIYCQLLGYAPDEVRKLTYQQITPERWHAFEQKIVEEQILARGYSDIYEKEYRRKDGTLFPVELRTILARDAHGQPAAMWAIVRDITARKQAEDNLRAHMEELRELNDELTRFNQATVGRELRLIALKQEINALLAAAGQPPRYKVDFDEN